MKQLFRICVPLLAAISLVACGDDKAGDNSKLDTASDGSTANAVESSDAGTPSSGPYKVKSGIIESSVEMMGEQKQTTYFDDYGTKQTIVTEMDIMGQKSQTIAITADGWQYTYDPEKKEGTKMKMPATAMAPGGMPNLEALTDEMKAEYKVKELESRTVAGKETVGMSVEAAGIPMKVWTWQGIPLRTEIEMGEKPVVTEVKNLQVDVDVPADRFVVPADVKITEIGK